MQHREVGEAVDDRDSVQELKAVKKGAVELENDLHVMVIMIYELSACVMSSLELARVRACGLVCSDRAYKVGLNSRLIK